MLIERITTALHLPSWPAKADGQGDYCTPEGVDCICYFARDWEKVFDGYGPDYWACASSLIGVMIENEDGTLTPYNADAATEAFGLEWVRSVEGRDEAEAVPE